MKQKHLKKCGPLRLGYELATVSVIIVSRYTHPDGVLINFDASLCMDVITKYYGT